MEDQIIYSFWTLDINTYLKIFLLLETNLFFKLFIPISFMQSSDWEECPWYIGLLHRVARTGHLNELMRL